MARVSALKNIKVRTEGRGCREGQEGVRRGCNGGVERDPDQHVHGARLRPQEERQGAYGGGKEGVRRG
eukprot:876436-Prorocentrum_minimum.AAC.2